MEALIALATATFVAVLSAILALKLPRVKPMLLIDSIKISTAYPAPGRLNSNSRLVQEIEEYAWSLHDGPAVRGPVEEGAYVEYLTTVKQGLTTDTEYTWPHVIDIASQLRSQVVGEEFRAFDELFAREQEYIWRVIATDALRGADPFSSAVLPTQPALTDGFTHPAHEIRKSGARYLVILAGARDIQFDWEGDGYEGLESVAERCAQAIAYRSRSDLLALTDRLRASGEAWREITRKMVDRIDGELEPLGRIAVSGVIANTGDKVFSVVNAGKLVIHLTNYPLRDQSSEEEPRVIGHDLAYWCRIGRSEPRDFDNPIVLDPGSSQRFVAVVRDVVTRLEYGSELLRAYSAAERTAQLVVAVLLPASDDVRTDIRKRFPSVISADDPTCRRTREAGGNGATTESTILSCPTMKSRARQAPAGVVSIESCIYAVAATALKQ